MKKALWAVIALIVAMTVVGCNVASDNSQKKLPQSSTNLEMGFVVKLPSNKSRGSYYSAEDAAYYEINLSKQDELVESKKGLPGETVSFIVKEEGTYIIEVKAYDESNDVIAQGSTEKTVSYAEGMVDVVVTIYAKGKPFAINVDVQWSTPTTTTTTTTTINQYVSLTGVYKFTDSISSISTAWGGSTSNPSFSIILIDSTGIDALKDGIIMSLQDMPVGCPVYQICNEFPNSNLTFPTIEGSWIGSSNCFCVKVEQSYYTLYFDSSKIEKTMLKGLGHDFFNGEKIIEESDNVDLTGYIPCVLALSDNTSDSRFIVPNIWNANPMFMDSCLEPYPDYTAQPVIVNCSIRLIIDESTDLLLTDVNVYKSCRTRIEGTGFGWTGGETQYYVFDNIRDFAEFNLVGLNEATWIEEQSPWNCGYEDWPEGFNKSLKLVIMNQEGWIPYIQGSSSTYSWNDRVLY